MARKSSLKLCRWFAVLAAVLILSPLCIFVLAEGQPGPFPEDPNSMTVVANPNYVPVDGSNVTITATVYDKYGNFCSGAKVYFNNSETNLGTLSGGYKYREITWGDGSTSYEWYNYTNEDGVATITLTPGATKGTEEVWVWIGEKSAPNLDKTVTVEITAVDTAPPSVTNPSSNPDVILNDNGRARAEGTNLTQINVTVTDDAGVASVTIDLSSIGGSPNQPMSQVEETDIWTVTTNATAGINSTHVLPINATDIYGKSNTTVTVQLVVLRRGDIVRDNVTDMKDMLYIARYTVGFEPEVSNPPSEFVGDMVGEAGNPAGDGTVDLKDALFIARWVSGLEEEP